MDEEHIDEANAAADELLELFTSNDEIMARVYRLNELGVRVDFLFDEGKPPSKKKLKKIKRMLRKAAKLERRAEKNHEKEIAVTVKEAKALNSAKETCPVCGKNTMHGILVSREKTEEHESVAGPQLRRTCQNPECRFGDVYPVA